MGNPRGGSDERARPKPHDRGLECACDLRAFLYSQPQVVVPMEFRQVSTGVPLPAEIESQNIETFVG